MSRICVKNLPKYVAEDRLREVFSRNGEITDAKLMRTKDGKSRQFAFIGFRTEQEAEEAIKYFNKSYLDTCRITCEIAHKVGDPNIPRPWSRYSLKKEEKATEDGKKVVDDGERVVGAKGGAKKSLEQVTENEDPLFQEFLQVMQPRVKSKMWENDTLIASTVGHNVNAEVAKNKSLVNEEVKEKSVALHDESNKNNVMSDSRAIEKLQNVAHDEVISDMDYFKSRVKKDWSDSESDDNIDDKDDDDDDDNDNNSLEGEHDSLPKGAAQLDVEEEDINGETVDLENPSSSLNDEQEESWESGRLFVRNLPYMASEDELKELFGKFGNVSEVHIVVDKDTKRSKGIAYILFALPESASRAIVELDNSIFQGRLLHVMPARNKNSSNKQESGDSTNHGSKTLKQRREEERKASEASGNTKAWNSLFMRPDTVVENIARKYGVSKSDLLDREADDLAVRIALGETQVIAETKKALRNAGVNVSSLEEFAAGKSDGMKRSNHVFIVKNLPYDSSEGELAKMFGRFGSLDKIIIPPTKTLALVVFLEPAEATAAFKGLAYKRYKGVPLYLEWAPSDVLSQNSTSGNNGKNSAVGEHDAKRVILEQHLEGMSDADLDPDRVESRSLFVKNLNFKTSDENLRKHFNEHMKEGRILSVKVKKHVKNGKNVSMGFGFIEFDSMETATNISRDLQGTILDGHALILQLCHAKKDEPVMKKVEKDRSSTKILVRNVAFEATEKDLRQLFSPFGQIKSVRLPMKFGNHRGFGFVEFVTKQEAQTALQALSSTHLYGRHLVLERAKEGESLEELRARTAAQFTDEANGFQNTTKLSKKRKHMAILDEGSMRFDRITE
ncbi:multiple RNA-binding domain-containing protein 1 isoform X3 [Mangifera indica]|uniref:multiple RNA-binding domain-containing protein 1 isoform X2 n=1 Tax=Mangifera indica TaxID=29780 RepID=UPI001CFC04A9|nr:multiple RNA-binding domain-containing protein 1 isoform X2 [Mangifera indica]XP_044491837.1 multiple RNA-binding domain-containing protein 1 isoform X3 [Mangifera indica]